jgi:hypothetical protein
MYVMKFGRIVLFAGSLWETFRFLLVFLFIVSFTGIMVSPTRVLLLSWLGGIQLIMVMGYLFLALHYEKYMHFTTLLAFGKLLNVFPAILLIVFEIEGSRALMSSLLMNNGSGTQSELKSFLFLVIFIAVLDLLFFIFLLLFKSGKKSDKVDGKEPHRIEPEVQELTIEEE